ncbi:MAG: hypothetical protein MJ123_02300 [Lachnospiraceae bacterium]|nr:hypothetical protein [Lachnospiraceae bacterium]
MIGFIVFCVALFFFIRFLNKKFKELAEDQAYLRSVDEPHGEPTKYSDKVFEGSAIGGFTSTSAAADFTNASLMNNNSISKS